MSAVTRYQGDDIPISIGLTDANGDAINIDNLAELYIYLMRSGNNTPAKKFSKAGTTGYKALVRVDTENYRADWLSADTKSATPGNYHLEINVVETDADYNDSEKNSIGTDAVINLKKSVVKAESS